MELLNPLSDILRLRVYGSSAKEGSLFMEDAINLYENARKLLTATAMDIVRPRLLHSGRPPANIADFISKCRFGQTEIGSYVVSVVCPIARLDPTETLQLTLHDEKSVCAESITRQVVNKLVTSVTTVKEAVIKGNLEDVINQNAESNTCISANFLDALSGISIYQEQSSLDIAAKYAPTIKLNTLPNAMVSIDHEYYAPINTAVKNIKRVQEREEAFIGLIGQCKALPDLAVRKQGSITLVYLDKYGNPKTTPLVILPLEDYNSAVTAHNNGKMVKVVGTLLNDSTGKKIESSYFEVLT